MFCAKCGNQIPDGLAFCPMCGARIGADVNNQSVATVQNVNNQSVATVQNANMVNSHAKAKSKAPIMIAVALISAVAIFLIIGAATGLFGKKNSLYGTWYNVEEPDDGYMVISEDSLEIYVDDSLFYSFDIEVDDNTIKVSNPYGGTAQIMTYEVSGDELYMTNGAGERQKFVTERLLN